MREGAYVFLWLIHVNIWQKPRFDSWVGKSPWRRDRLPTPVFLGIPGSSDNKESTSIVGDLGLVPGWEDPLEEDMATHSSILAWRIPWAEEPGRLQSMGLQRVRHDCSDFSTHICIIIQKNANFLANPMFCTLTEITSKT